MIKEVNNLTRGKLSCGIRKYIPQGITGGKKN